MMLSKQMPLTLGNSTALYGLALGLAFPNQ